MRLRLSLLVLGALSGDCGPQERTASGRLVETRSARCDVGGKPGYFVPASSPPVLVGCARLGVSGKRVEFSRSRARIDGESHVCIDPAYGRGRFIPGICALRPRPSSFAIHDADQPRQGVRGHAFVIWGTAPAGTATVVGRSGSALARAAVFDVAPGVAEPSFAVFVLELPLSAGCDGVTVVASGADTVERVRPRRAACARAKRSRPRYIPRGAGARIRGLRRMGAAGFEPATSRV